MKRIVFILFLTVLVSGCQVSNLVNFNSSKLTPEYACILQETYSKNNEEVPDDLSKFLKEEKKEKKDEDDDDFFIVKRPRIK